MPSINDDDLFDFNGFAAKSKDKNEAAALEGLQDRMGEVVSNLENQVRTAIHRAENILGLSRAEAYRSATATIGSAQGPELPSSDATRSPQALESDEIIDPQVANLETEVSRLRQDNAQLTTAAQRASNLQEQLDGKDREIAQLNRQLAIKDEQINNLIATQGGSRPTTPPAAAAAPTPSPAPAGPAAQPRHATPAPTPPTAPPATAAPAQPATPATATPAQSATPTQPVTPAPRTQQTPPRRTPDQRPAGNFGPAAGSTSETTNPPTRVMPAQPQQRPQRQPRQQGPGLRARANAFLFGPEPEEPNRNRQSR